MFCEVLLKSGSFSRLAVERETEALLCELMAEQQPAVSWLSVPPTVLKDFSHAWPHLNIEIIYNLYDCTNTKY